MSVKICFSSDLHGNFAHLRQILATSVQEQCDVVILGGDLAPRGSGMGVEGNRLHHFLPHDENGRVRWESVEALEYMREAYHRQGYWFEDVLVPTLAAHSIPTVCLFGNSDWRGLMSRCHRAAKAASEAAGAPGRVRFVEGDVDFFTIETLARCGETAVAAVDVFSCSLVPVCSHKKKDWERCDTRCLEDTTSRAPNMDPEGFASAGVSACSTASSTAPTEVSDEDVQVVRHRLEVTEEAARDNSIEAALERLVVRWQKKQAEREQKQRQEGGMKRKADNGTGPIETDTRKAERGDTRPSPALSVPPVWVIHAPPRDTVADLCTGRASCYSFARETCDDQSSSTSSPVHTCETVGVVSI